MDRAALFALLALLVGVAFGCESDPGHRAASASPDSSPSAAHYHWRPAPGEPRSWAVLLPGASGLKVFDDEHHYFLAADELNRHGIDALVVDYKPAYLAMREKPAGLGTGEKIALVIGHAVRWMRGQHPRTSDRPGALVAWSLGAEGALRVINDDTLRAELNIDRAVMYYPSNEDELRCSARIPVLIFAGEADDVTRLSEIRAWSGQDASGHIQLITYPDAHHGFDIASIPSPRRVSLLPIIGPSATFAYNAAAAEDARARTAQFLSRPTPAR